MEIYFYKFWRESGHLEVSGLSKGEITKYNLIYIIRGNWLISPWYCIYMSVNLVSVDTDNGLSLSFSAPSCYRTQRWFMVNSNLRNKPQWNLNKDTSFLFICIHLKMSVKWQPFCPDDIVLKLTFYVNFTTCLLNKYICIYFFMSVCVCAFPFIYHRRHCTGSWNPSCRIPMTYLAYIIYTTVADNLTTL